jgi:hypothetical protein
VKSEDFMCEVVQALNATHVPYMVVGSLSSNVYGIPRSTKDADFVLELGSIPIERVMQQLGQSYKLDPQMSFETITSTLRYRILHQASAFLIELFLLSNDAHDRERFARRRIVKYAGHDVYVATAEDVIVTKLRWSRQGKRAKDIEDVRSVVSMQNDKVDWDYVHRWCDAHGTRSLLEEIRRSIPMS